MIRKILQKDDPVLHKVCHPVTKFDGKLADLLEDLTATLAQANGLGLAAPQIGILRRVCVVMDEDETYLELLYVYLFPGGGAGGLRGLPEPVRHVRPSSSAP